MIRTFIASIMTLGCLALMAQGRSNFELGQITPKASSPDDRPAENSRAIIERIKANQNRVRKLLGDKDSGEVTGKLQRQIADDLAKLLETPDEPNRDPSGNGAGSAQAKPAAKRPRSAPSEPATGVAKATVPKDPQKEAGSNGMEGKSREEEKRSAQSADGYWGGYPPRLRKEMESYPRERLMPRYEDMLRAYYRTLAERNASKGDQP